MWIGYLVKVAKKFKEPLLYKKACEVIVFNI